MKINIAILLLASLFFAPIVSAQDSDKSSTAKKNIRLTEIADLEAMLKSLDKAIDKLEPLVNPKVVFRQYRIRRLIYSHTDSYGPSLSVQSQAAGYRTGKGAKAGVLNFSDDGEEIDFDRCLEPDELAEMIRVKTGESAWDDPYSYSVRGEFLYVQNTELVHAKIKEILAELEAKIYRAIRYKVNFYSVSKEQKKKLFIKNKQGLLTPENLKSIDTALLGQTKCLLRETLISSMNGQRLYIHSGLEQSYVEDFESSSGGTGQVVSVVGDPVIATLRTGLVLDIRGTIVNIGEQEELNLDVRLRKSQLQAMRRRNSNWGPIDLPNISTESTRSAARIPNGSGMIVFSSSDKADPKARETIVVIRATAK